MSLDDVRLQREKVIAGAYQRLFETPEGQIVLRDLLRAGGILSVSHVAGAPDDSAFNDGRRSLALHVLDRLRWSEGEMVKLALERTAERLSQGDEEAA